MQRDHEYIKQETEQMKYNSQQLIEETNYLRQLNLDETSQLNSINEEIKRLNKNISSIRKEKESLGASIVQIRKHINQLEHKIVVQSQSTKDFIWSMAQFQSSISKREGTKPGRNVKVASSLSISKSLK